MEYETNQTEITIGSLRLCFTQIHNVEAAIDAMFRELEARGSGELLEDLCPYFGSVWPSARVLSQWVWSKGDAAFRGKSVMEVGCGLALPSFVVSHFGARSVATDLHPDVPGFLRTNLEQNPGFSIEFKTLDWRRPTEEAIGTFDWVLASDVLYEKYQAASLVDFLKRHLALEGEAILVDPNRAYWERLVVLARHAGFYVEVQDCLDQDKVFRLVSIRHSPS
jgi:predicted nicotinamide N-methyase